MSYAAIGTTAPPPGGRPPGACNTDAQGVTTCPTFDPTWYLVGWAAVIGVVAFIFWKTIRMSSSVPMLANNRARRRRLARARKKREQRAYKRAPRPALVGASRRWGLMLPNGSSGKALRSWREKRPLKCVWCNWSPDGMTLPRLAHHVQSRHKSKYDALVGTTMSATEVKLRKAKIKRRKTSLKINAGSHSKAFKDEVAKIVKRETAKARKAKRIRRKKAARWEWVAPRLEKNCSY